MVCGIGIYGRTNTAGLNPPPPSPLLDKEGGLIAGVVHWMKPFFNKYAIFNWLKNKISSNEIILELNLSENEIEIMADSIQLELIINNLIQNAIDSIKDKNIHNGKIEIKTYIDDYIIFEITDNGLGFDDEIKEKIFDPLFSTKHNKGGTGLGLAIVDRFLTRMGAKITAHNLNFNGALFQIKFNKINY